MDCGTNAAPASTTFDRFRSHSWLEGLGRLDLVECTNSAMCWRLQQAAKPFDSGPRGRLGRKVCVVPTSHSPMTIRPLRTDDVDIYLRNLCETDAESGVDGAAHSHPYGKSEPFDIGAARDRELQRWSTAIDDLAWRRAWGLFDSVELVGHIYLAGANLRSELHRVELGMGIRRSHHRRGGGTFRFLAVRLIVFASTASSWMTYRCHSKLRAGDA